MTGDALCCWCDGAKRMREGLIHAVSKRAGPPVTGFVQQSPRKPRWQMVCNVCRGIARRKDRTCARNNL